MKFRKNIHNNKIENISKKLNDIAMDNNHLKHDGNYIDDLIEKINKMNKK